MRARGWAAASARPPIGVCVTTSIDRQIAKELFVREEQVAAAVALLDDGATVPFIARYRKEATGSEEDIAKCYELNANCYLKKPVQFDAFEDLVKSINDFWLTRVMLPQQKLAFARAAPPTGNVPAVKPRNHE
jgi:hypothetical protein